MLEPTMHFLYRAFSLFYNVTPRIVDILQAGDTAIMHNSVIRGHYGIVHALTSTGNG